MPAARLVCGSTVVVDQMDIVPSPGQIVVALDGARFRVTDEKPEIHHINLGAGFKKWMAIVKAEAIAEKT